MAGSPNAQRLAELAALVDAVKERVRTQYPDTTANWSSGTVCVGLPDLTSLARARDAAAGKMAAIGTVNPRQGGAINGLVQAVKRAIARGLNWFVRDQVIFNRQMITCVEACIEALNDMNRTIQLLAGQANTEIQRVRTEAEPLRRDAEILRAKTSDFEDLVSHWNHWREEWQLKLHRNEVAFLKSVADLNVVFQQKLLHTESAAFERCAQVEAAFEQSREKEATHAALLETSLRKIATELDASYRQTATHLEAACHETGTRIEKSFTEAVVSLEAGFRATATELENSYRAVLNQTAESIQDSVASQIDALGNEVRGSAIAMDQRLVKQALDFEGLVAASVTGLQNKFYADLDRIRTEYERVIHSELRVVRQRLAPGSGSSVAATIRPPEVPVVLGFDYVRFADRFRGSVQYVIESQRFYLPYFTGRRHVLDIGCGRGEFLKLMQEAGVPARGIEASDESVGHCRSLGLAVENADLFNYLSSQSEGSLDGIFCSQVVEHLPPERLPELIRLCATRLATGGILTIETPNPECLAIFATHFYLDPTHTRPVPAQLLAFYMEESGLGRVEIHPKSPAVESMPEVGELTAGFREKFFGGLDYAIIAYRL